MKIAVVCKQTADKRRNPHFVIGNLEKQLEAIPKAIVFEKDRFLFRANF